MKNGAGTIGGWMLIVFLLAFLKGCGSPESQIRYSDCMQGTYKINALFKATFVCLWQ
jgi:hypothetical protein